MRKTLLLVLVILMVTASAFAEAKPVTQTISKNVELAKGIQGTVEVSIVGKSWDKPAVATLKILHGEKVLFSSEPISFIKSKYFEQKHFTECKGYVDCHQAFFLNMIEKTVRSSSKDRYFDASRDLDQQILKEQMNKANVADKITIDAFAKYLQSEDYNQFFVPAGPYTIAALLVYNQQLNRLVDIDVE